MRLHSFEVKCTLTQKGVVTLYPNWVCLQFVKHWSSFHLIDVTEWTSSIIIINKPEHLVNIDSVILFSGKFKIKTKE